MPGWTSRTWGPRGRHYHQPLANTKDRIVEEILGAGVCSERLTQDDGAAGTAPEKRDRLSASPGVGSGRRRRRPNSWGSWNSTSIREAARARQRGGRRLLRSNAIHPREGAMANLGMTNNLEVGTFMRKRCKDRKL